MAELSQKELNVLAYTLLGEAAGEGKEGMAAVMSVIMNRAASGRYPSDLASVALQKNKNGVYQFSAWNKKGGGNDPKGTYSKSSPQFKEALQIVQSVMAGEVPDKTGGATHYYSKSMKSKPSWFDSEAPAGAVEIGNHVFGARTNAATDAIEAATANDVKLPRARPTPPQAYAPEPTTTSGLKTNKVLTVPIDPITGNPLAGAAATREQERLREIRQETNPLNVNDLVGLPAQIKTSAPYKVSRGSSAPAQEDLLPRAPAGSDKVGYGPSMEILRGLQADMTGAGKVTSTVGKTAQPTQQETRVEQRISASRPVFAPPGTNELDQLFGKNIPDAPLTAAAKKTTGAVTTFAPPKKAATEITARNVNQEQLRNTPSPKLDFVADAPVTTKPIASSLGAVGAYAAGGAGKKKAGPTYQTQPTAEQKAAIAMVNSEIAVQRKKVAAVPVTAPNAVIVQPKPAKAVPPVAQVVANTAVASQQAVAQAAAAAAPSGVGFNGSNVLYSDELAGGNSSIFTTNTVLPDSMNNERWLTGYGSTSNRDSSSSGKKK